jgi:hypothetical protein
VSLFSKKPKVSPAVGLLLSMDDKAIEKLLKEHKDTPYKSAKALRKATEDGRRPLEGEKGMGALLAGMKGGGTGNRNWKNQPVEARVHPSRHRAQLNLEVQEAIRTGDRARQAALKAEAQKHGYI